METIRRFLGCIACLTVVLGCEPIETPLIETSVGVFCETEYSVPSPYMGCTTIVGDFQVARDTDDCYVDNVQYSCLSTTDEVYVLGVYEKVDVVADVNGCSFCDGKPYTIK